MTGRFSYSRWDGTQVGFELDADAILEEITDDLLYHGDLNAALRRMMQSGLPRPQRRAAQGIREMLEKLRRKRRDELEQLRPRRRLRRHRPGAARGRRQEREALDELDAARPASPATSAARRSPSRSSTSGSMQLDMLPPDLAGQVRDLQQYDFTVDRGPRAVRGAARPAPPAAHAELLQPDGRRDAEHDARGRCSA